MSSNSTDPGSIPTDPHLTQNFWTRFGVCVKATQTVRLSGKSIQKMYQFNIKLSVKYTLHLNKRENVNTFKHFQKHLHTICSNTFLCWGNQLVSSVYRTCWILFPRSHDFSKDPQALEWAVMLSCGLPGASLRNVFVGCGYFIILTFCRRPSFEETLLKCDFAGSFSPSPWT